MLFEPPASYSAKKANLPDWLVPALEAAYGREPTPEDVFHYVYAVLYAPAYREKYVEFLRMDFPRIPFTADAGLFSELAALGKRLTALHLLKSPELDRPACRFDGQGDSRVAKGANAGLRYDPEEQRVYINATQYFGPVPESVWTYQVGGYRVCDKWLKDRQDRRLEVDDIRTYCRIVTALKLTLGIQQELNALYPQAERKTVPLPECGEAGDPERLAKRSTGRAKPGR
jgi:predicted helicase